MPLYLCNSAAGAIDDAAKSKIAADITRIHCDVTGAPPQFVHAFFLENAPHQLPNGMSAALLGSIRSGRTNAQKAQIADEMAQSIHIHAGVDLEEISVTTVDTKASWVMEGGDIFPEPGEEAAWLAARESKHVASSEG